MMSGAIWVKDQLELAGWEVQVAHARKVRDIAPLACKTDKVDARVLAELCRRDLVPAVWVASLEDRAIRERLRRRAHLVKLRTSASQPDLRPADPVRPADLVHPPAPARCDRAARAARRPRGLARLDRRAPATRSTSSTGGSARSTRELAPDRALRSQGAAAADDPRGRPLDRPHLRRGDRRRLSLLLGLEAGRLCRARAADQPVGRALGHRAAFEGRLADASLGRGRGRKPGLAADQSLPRALPPTRRPPRQEPGEVLGRAQAPDRPWHMLSRGQVFQPTRSTCR